MDIDTHPNPQPNSHHRKIDLQSPHDLTYLQNNLANSALQKLDLHFPKISKPATHISLDAQPQPKPTSTDTNETRDDEIDDDPMRRRVHDLITTFLQTTWQSANHNISVNGIDASSIAIPHTATLAPPPPLPTSTQTPPTEIEGIHYRYGAFDASLQHRLAALHGELESLTAQVSKLRRTAPAQGADAHQSRLRDAMDEDERRYEADKAEALGEELEGLDVHDVRPGWNEDVRDVYERGVSELAALAGKSATQDQVSRRERTVGVNSTLTETVGKAQRARRVAMELE